VVDFREKLVDLELNLAISLLMREIVKKDP